jgi:hypothetical protein
MSSRFPRNCRFSTCPFHNAGMDLFSNDATGRTIAQTHGLQLHAPLLCALPLTDLASIGWHRCCHDCSTAFLVPTDIISHRASCPIYIAAPPPFHPPTDSLWAYHFTICPPSRTPDLHKLLLTATEDSADDDFCQALYDEVLSWHRPSTPPAPTSPATPYHDDDL